MKMVHLDWVQIIKDIIIGVIVSLISTLVLSTFNDNQATQIHIEQNIETKIEVVINNY